MKHAVAAKMLLLVGLLAQHTLQASAACDPCAGSDITTLTPCTNDAAPRCECQNDVITDECQARKCTGL
eukprot:2023673-Rhodomonas_salina.1